MLKPLPAQQWSRENAVHLLNRAGFGATPEEIAVAEEAGLAKTLDRLLLAGPEPSAPADASWTEPDDLGRRLRQARMANPDPAARRAQIKKAVGAQRDETAGLRRWWLDLMRRTQSPLAEKMTLFWHGHFATSMQKVRNIYWMWRQNQTFRRYAFGNFRDLLKAVSRDPAMMVYLDLAQSKEEHPNENWSREVMELFTLGIGHYSEQDVREAARAFTGYKLNFVTQQFRYLPRLHDGGQKTFMNRTGHLDGDDILDTIVAQPACAEFIAQKLWRFFAEDDPPNDIIQSLGASLRGHNFELRPTLRDLFASSDFYADRIRRNQIKSPVQFLVGSCRLLETELPPARVLNGALAQLGQLLFAPPNVKGWDGGQSWISTSTLLLRYNFADYLLQGAPADQESDDDIRRAPLAPARLIPENLRGKPEELVAHLAQRLYQAPANEKLTKALLAYLKSRAPDTGDETIRRLLRLMMSTPQYQLV
ncbi:MAG: DUF1800 domain-containing protein [Chthoniobacterales bacterium]